MASYYSASEDIVSSKHRYNQIRRMLRRSKDDIDPENSLRSKKQRKRGTEVNDNVHGLITVPSLCKAIIDTPQFQRLRLLKQLGTCSYVFPAGNHCRFQHSLGVMHLAGEFADEILKNTSDGRDQPILSPKDKLCLQVAGLCHDLGHGPYSHLWETFLGKARDGKAPPHEKTTLDMLDYLIQDNQLQQIFLENDIQENDIEFIKELIYGPLDDTKDVGSGSYPYKGRGPEKYFLYEIVANKTTDIDVDKMDYFMRDNKAMEVGVTFDHTRFFRFSDVLEWSPPDGSPSRMRLCIRDKEADNLQEMFGDRNRLHRKGYQHRVVKIIDRMMVDAWLAADDHIKVTGKNGQQYKLSEACDDVSAFVKLTDEWLNQTIVNSDNPQLKESRNLLLRISKREFYQLLNTVEFCGKLEDTAAMEDSLQEMVADPVESDDPATTLTPADLCIVKRTVQLGKKPHNPIEDLLFYDKNFEICKITANELKSVTPEELRSEKIFILCKNRNEAVIKKAGSIVGSWIHKKGFNDAYTVL